MKQPKTNRKIMNDVNARVLGWPEKQIPNQLGQHVKRVSLYYVHIMNTGGKDYRYDLTEFHELYC